MIVLIDHYDSFIYNILHYVLCLGRQIDSIRPEECTIFQLDQMKVTSIILGPGPGKPGDYPLAFRLLEYAIHKKLPVLGICLGHQMIAEFFGGTVEASAVPVHGKLSTIVHRNEGIFHGLPSFFNVVRYHSLKVNQDHLPVDLQVVAYAKEDDTIQAIQHMYYPIYGIQFHPESVLTECGHRLLAQFLSLSLTS